jgi:hypothetical protein
VDHHKSGAHTPSAPRRYRSESLPSTRLLVVSQVDSPRSRWMILVMGKDRICTTAMPYEGSLFPFNTGPMEATEAKAKHESGRDTRLGSG